MVRELNLDKAFIELDPLIDDAKEMVDCLDRWTREMQQHRLTTPFCEWTKEYKDGPNRMAVTIDNVYKELYVWVKDGKIIEQCKFVKYDPQYYDSEKGLGSVRYKYKNITWSIDYNGALKTLTHNDRDYMLIRSKGKTLKKLILE